MKKSFTVTSMAEKAAAPVKEEAVKVEKAEEKKPKTTKSKSEVKEVKK